MARFGSLAAAAIGGTAGSLIRWGLLTVVATDREELLIIGLNVFASAMLGVVIGRREVMNDTRFHLIGTGFAGGLSTFSTFAITVALHLENGALLSALADVAATTTLVVIAAGIGYRLSRLVQIRRPRLATGSGR
ncbi:MAG: fluoride efflux transporter FluC [Acidimicrobiales bacterium]